MVKKSVLIALLFACTLAGFAQMPQNAAGKAEEVIYGRKNGMALTMNVLTPKGTSNGKGVILAISAGMKSNWEMAIEWSATIAQPFLMKGYTVFEVCHGSAPQYNNQEIVSDLHRAVRFIRYNAAKYGISPDKLGMTGASSGGYLSLMMGNTGLEGDPQAKDPVDRVPGNVQAVACFFPPTDFLNFGKEGVVSLGTGQLAEFRAAFAFRIWNKDLRKFDDITDHPKLLEIGREISPIYHVTAQSAPTLLAHGDMDELIPLQQSEIFIKKLKQNNVPCELMIKKGGTHKAWPDMLEYLVAFSNWFDKYLQ